MSQEARESEALWVAPRSMADIEDEVVNTVSSSLLSDRGINAKTDLQARHLLHFLDLSGACPCLRLRRALRGSVPAIPSWTLPLGSCCVSLLVLTATPMTATLLVLKGEFAAFLGASQRQPV